jgi:hypothetical protein
LTLLTTDAYTFFKRNDEEEYAATGRVREGRLRVRTFLDGEAEHHLRTAA